MNAKRYMLLVKGVNRTVEIRSCKYNRNTKKWDIEFYSGEKKACNYSDVEWLREPVVLNPNLYRIKAGRELFNIDAIYVFKGRFENYWHICFSDGSERDYKESQLNIAKSCLSDRQANNVFEYMKQIAKLSDLKNKGTDEKLLAKKFEKITFVRTEVALAKYLNPASDMEDKKTEYIPIFPFGCNNSQYMAVKNAMENQISVIQGPPGTGKTQTILNIIANILLQGKTVQVVSNNNSATENVYEKLASAKYNIGFIVATLGKADNKKIFIEKQDSSYPDFTSWQMEDKISLDSIRAKSQELKDVFDKQKELASLRQEKAQLITELEYFNQYMDETDVDVRKIRTKKVLSSKKWMALWNECRMVSEKRSKVGILFRLRGFFVYGILNFDFYKQDVAKIISTFQAKYYEARSLELSNRISEIETFLKDGKDRLLEELCEQSMSILKDNLAEKYRGKERRVLFTEDDLWKNAEAFLDEYPVILSTTFSSRNSLNTETVYDYLIMDEASQVDVATGALALSCARNVVIVGDTKQLPNVVKEDIRKQSEAIFNSFSICDGYRFTKSFLQSILEVMPNVSQTLLREHYRCHPKIINFCNQKFYRNELIIMTEDRGEEDVLTAVKTVPGNHVRNHYSQRQIDVIREEIIPKYVVDKRETGIIAPYNNQVEALEKEFTDILVATVHKFQGKEKDNIIISTVDDEITDFADDPYLINVAVSRAKKKLMLVVTGNEQPKERNITDLVSYIQYNNFEVVDSKVYSVFDYLYKQYTEEKKEYLRRHKRVSTYDSENLMHALIEDILSKNEYACFGALWEFPLNMLIKDLRLLNERECQYVMNPATHVDFIIYNRITKKAVLAIEVDGYDYHREDTVQASRDVMKDHVLDLYEIPHKRFKTNGSNERRQIEEMLDKYVG